MIDKEAGMNNCLYLFPDTNLFIQCKALQEIDWSVFDEFDEVNLIVSRPVTREIDYQKNKTGRLGDRARKTSSQFREILLSKDELKIIKKDGPLVKMEIKPEYNYKDGETDSLNMEEKDDQLVATVIAFSKKYPERIVKLATHDTGPMATAKMMSVDVHPIPEDWLLLPENSDSEKNVKKLEEEVSRLKKAEPKIKVECIDNKGDNLKQIDFTTHYYAALTTKEVDTLIEELQETSPIKVDFSKPDGVQNQFNLLGYSPPSENRINEYKNETYPLWLDKCRELFLVIHSHLQKNTDKPTFTFLIRNEGSRPGKDVLVEIEAFGNIDVMPILDGNDDDDDLALKNILLPPEPPVGGLMNLMNYSYSGSGIRSDLLNIAHTPLSMSASKFYRDQNTFYYKDEPENPVSSYSLECVQFRHGVEQGSFNGKIYVNGENEKISGLVKCTVHAENLSNPVSKSLPVKVSVTKKDTFNEVKQLINNLKLDF